MGGTIRAIGLMSGTSADGVDAAALDTDGRGRVRAGPWLTVAYEPALRRRLLALDRRDEAGTRAVESALTDAHIAAVARLGARPGAPAALLGFHGHTIHHDPARGVTRQIGDARRLAEACGVDAVADFRSADMAAGGQGAPLAPLYHAALAAGLEKPLAVLNIGGVANVTYLGADDGPDAGAAGGGGRGSIAAFDTGPGNALLDDWAARRAGLPMDRGGRLAAAGAADETRLAALMADPYFSAPAPKSLDRGHFSALADGTLEGLSAADGAATLVAFTAAAAAAALRLLPRAPKRWLVCGGGRRNPALMRALAARLGAPVDPVEAAGWDGDALEAQAFAWLAVRSVRGLPLSLPQTTGVRAPCPGGRLYRARPRRGGGGVREPAPE